MWYRSEGILSYYPYGDWWVILNCCEDLCSFYRKQAEEYLGYKLNKPKHGSHISIVRGEGEPKNKEHWFWNNDGAMEFEYSPEVVFGNTHIWLKVRSDSLIELRRNLGLEDLPPYGFHLTLGRML